MTTPTIIAHRVLSPGALANDRSILASMTPMRADLVVMEVRLSLDRRPFVVPDRLPAASRRGDRWIRLWPSIALRVARPRLGRHRKGPAPLRRILETLPDAIQPALYLRDRAALRPVLREIERYGEPGRTWLWLERPEDVFIATRKLPEIRCTLLRPGGWTMLARDGYFRDAQRSGAHGVSIPPGVITRDLVAHAHRHRLQVFSRLDDVAALPGLLDAGIDGVMTDDAEAVAKAIRRSTP